MAGANAAARNEGKQDIAWCKVIGLIAEQPQSASENAVKQIDRNAELLRSRLSAMQDLADAAKKLYATLSDDQKVVAERMLGTTVPPAYAGRGTGPR
jgi:hypothetical protein